MGNIFTVGPNEALVISGGLCGSTKKTHVYGGWAWSWWCLSDVQAISLEVMTLNPRCEHVETAQGVPLTVTGVAQVKVMTEKEFLASACEQFLGKSTKVIESVLLQTLEGHLRSILGTLTVEAIYRDRNQFAETVRLVAEPDLCRMGMQILSFAIKDVTDDVDYLNSLGRTQVAMIRRDAEIGVAEANRDAGIKEAYCDKDAMDIKYQTDSKVANSKREFELKQSCFDMEVNAQKANAELAYALQTAKETQKIRQEEIMIEVVERRKLISVAALESDRIKKELQGTVYLPAEAEAFRIQTIAEGKRYHAIAQAEAESEAVRIVGSSEAASIEAVGRAQAERMRMRAAAYRLYGTAAVQSLVLEKMPLIAAEVAAPLANVKEVVIMGGGGGRTTDEVTRLIATLPPTVEALTGIDLKSMMQKVTM